MTRGRIVLSLLVGALMSGCTRSKPATERPSAEKQRAEESSVEDPSAESTGGQATQAGEVHDASGGPPGGSVWASVSTSEPLDVLEPGGGDVQVGSGGTEGAGAGSSDGTGPAPGNPEVRPGEAAGTRDLDKHTIREHIRSVLPRVLNCYELELSNDSTLKGTVVVNFQIAPSGAVEDASAEGVSEKVASCVAGVIETIQFPKPASGGVVQVRYPFRFRPAGG